MSTEYKIAWDNGRDCGVFPMTFDNEQAAEDYARDWQVEMVAATPGASEDDYSYEVVESSEDPTT